MCYCMYYVTDVFQQSYFYNDDTFNYNYGQAKASIGDYKEAEEVNCLLL